MRYITGESRQQATLLPATLDDYVTPDHPVRIIDAVVDSPDLKELGFSKADTCNTERKTYHPGDLLKLYILIPQSGAIQSPTKEGMPAQSGVIMVVAALTHDFKAIADFRKDNSLAIRCTCRTFIQFCPQVSFLTGRLVAIDGSKFKASCQ